MCGRYVSVRASTDLLDEFDAVDSTDKAATADYNVAPTKSVLAVVNRPLRDENGEATGEPVRQLRALIWGLVPSWAKDVKIGSRMINARAETVATSGAFRRAYASRRCLIPADGWYEWKKEGGTKQAFYMTPPDGHVLALAGLYEFWRPPGDDADLLATCTILTVDSAGALAEVHDRMPLVLAAEDWATWLDPTEKDPSGLLVPWSGEGIELIPVADTVNNVRNNGPELIKPVEPHVEPQTLF